MIPMLAQDLHNGHGPRHLQEAQLHGGPVQRRHGRHHAHGEAGGQVHHPGAARRDRRRICQGTAAARSARPTSTSASRSTGTWARSRPARIPAALDAVPQGHAGLGGHPRRVPAGDDRRDSRRGPLSGDARRRRGDAAGLHVSADVPTSAKQSAAMGADRQRAVYIIRNSRLDPGLGQRRPPPDEHRRPRGILADPDPGPRRPQSACT